MRRSSFAALALLILGTASPAARAFAQQKSTHVDHPTPSPMGMAAPLAGTVVLDGRLDEPAWQAVTPLTDFTQSQPHEGDPATQRTEVRFLFDNDALYIGARMFDTEGATGVRTRLSRRDNIPDADYLQIIFDTFHDHLGRVAFLVNPSGVKNDSYGPGGANLDDSWDAVWDVATRVDSLGWTAEFRIPLGQLRYPRDSVQTWGLQIWRMESRLNELSQWSFWRRNEVGGPSRFGHLQGLRVTRGPERAEVVPYVVGSTANDPTRDPTDPFRSPHEQVAHVGADFRYLLNSNLTLSGTINPDFGQVEVDPAVVNLTAFETYFPERRPFFVEGGGLFSFGSFNCFFCSNTSSTSLFYPHRIGRAPQGAGNAYAAGRWADVPQSTGILGAAKLTGRTGAGWTIAALDAVTARETARVEAADSSRFNVQVEPLTNYFVGRLSKDLRGGNYIHGMVTSVVRDLRDSILSTQLNRHSEAAGLETSMWWGRHTYRFMGNVALTQIAGDSLDVLRVQRSSARYFQRPDRATGSNGLFSNRYDSSLTTLRGYAAYGRLAKDAGDWEWEVAGSVHSPGFEANDVAFNSQADRIWMSGNVFRLFTHPNRFAREMYFIAGGQQAYNYSHDLVDRQVQAFAEFLFHNYWDVRTYYIYRPPRLDDQLARGGPVLGRTAQHYVESSGNTDTRKAVALFVDAWTSCRDAACTLGANLSATLRPFSNVSLTLGPSYNDNRSRSQYVTAVADSTATLFYGRRYIFADLRDRELSMETRLSVTFTPTLSLDLYAQPLIASERFSAFKEFDRPRSTDRSVYGVDRGTIAKVGTRYVVDPDGAAGPADTLSFQDPNFNFRSLRGNAVLRWEFHPGSTLFLVWTQQRSGQDGVGDLRLDRDLRALGTAHPANVFLVKVSYWFGF